MNILVDVVKLTIVWAAVVVILLEMRGVLEDMVDVACPKSSDPPKPKTEDQEEDWEPPEPSKTRDYIMDPREKEFRCLMAKALRAAGAA